MKDFLGKQYMLELFGCDAAILNDVEAIEEIMVAAAKIGNATMVNQYFHQFSPHGISGTIVITESHINIHTWPEFDFAAVDIFTCSEDIDVEKACAYLAATLKAEKHEIQSYERGSRAMIKKVCAGQTPNHHQ